MAAWVTYRVDVTSALVMCRLTRYSNEIFKWKQTISCQTAARGLLPFFSGSITIWLMFRHRKPNHRVKCHSFWGRAWNFTARRSLDRSSENCILRPSKRRAPAVKVQRAHGDGPVVNFSKEEKWPIGGQRRKKPTPAVPPQRKKRNGKRWWNWVAGGRSFLDKTCSLPALTVLGFSISSFGCGGHSWFHSLASLFFFWLFILYLDDDWPSAPWIRQLTSKKASFSSQISIQLLPVAGYLKCTTCSVRLNHSITEL